MWEPEVFSVEIDAALARLPSRDIPSVRRIRREFSRNIAAASPREVVRLARRLLEQPTSLRRFVAYELLTHHDGARKSLSAAQLERLAAGFSDWAAVDTFGCYLSGPAWRDGQVEDRVIHAWAARSDLWWRRAALVSTIACARRGAAGDTGRVLEVCELLADDREDMVVKAVSWSLRELVRTDARAVKAFVARSALAARVVREVRNKLEHGLKNPRKQTR